MVSFYDPDEHAKKKRVDQATRNRRREERKERNASLEGEQAVLAAKEAALRLLDRQDRSRGDLQAKLRERGFQPEPISEALDRLEDADITNDERYARMLVRTRHAERGLVGRALVQQLIRKRIPSDIIDLALEEVEHEDVEDAALDLVRKRLRSMSGLNRETKFRRLSSMLARKGYSPGVCYGVVNRALDESEED